MNEKSRQYISITKEKEHELRELFCTLDYSKVDDILFPMPLESTRPGWGYSVCIDKTSFTVEKIEAADNGVPRYIVGTIDADEIRVEWNENGEKRSTAGIAVPFGVYDAVEKGYNEKFKLKYHTPSSVVVEKFSKKLKGFIAAKERRQEEMARMDAALSKIDFSKANYITKTVQEWNSSDEDDAILTYHVCIGGNILKIERVPHPTKAGNLVYLASVNDEEVYPGTPLDERLTLSDEFLKKLEDIYRAHMSFVDKGAANILEKLAGL